MLFLQEQIGIINAMTSNIVSAIPLGYNGRLVTVEGDSNRGIPNLSIVGMGNRTIDESRHRVRSAITNSGFSFPDSKITINQPLPSS